MPYIILWDTRDLDKQTYMQIDYERERPIGAQIADIVNTVYEFDFNWERIEEYYKRNCKQLEVNVSVGIQLRRIFEISKCGIPIDDLLRDGFNENACMQLQGNNRCVPIYKFLDNYKLLCGDNAALLEEMEDIIEKYIGHLYTTKFPYPEIKRFIENTSVGYISRAESIVMHRRNSNDHSLAIYCMGKALEDELNLGFVHLIRKELEIDLPKYYNRYEQGKRAICTYDGRHYNYNKRKDDNSLMYPQISVSRSIIFENSSESISVAIRDILHDGNLNQWLNDVKCIADMRNRAVHNSEPLNREDYNKIKDAYKNLIRTGFFEYNSNIKNLLKQ